MHEDTLQPALRPCGVWRRRWADPAAREAGRAERMVTLAGKHLSEASTQGCPARYLFPVTFIGKIFNKEMDPSAANVSLNA